MFKSLACCGSQPHHEARRPYAQMQDGQMMQTPAAKRQDVEGAQQQQQQLVTAARAISAEATAAKKSRSDPLPSGKKARCRPSKDTMEGWGDIICSSTTKKPVGNAEDPMFKAPFLRKEWLNIVEKAQNSAEWDAALAKGWIKPADMGGKKHDKQCVLQEKAGAGVEEGKASASAGETVNVGRPGSYRGQFRLPALASGAAEGLLPKSSRSPPDHAGDSRV